jgi:hypothetical protein
LAEAIGVLSHERGLAEQGASFLRGHAPDDVEGRALYAQAKAAFDGLIDQLLADLAQGRDPQTTPELRAQVERAVEQRLAFSRHVDAVLKRVVPENAKPAWADALAATAGELVKQIFAGGVLIWREARAARSERRKEIAIRLEAQRWKPFAEIPAVT